MSGAREASAPLFILGLTGGIAAGKSTASAWFRRRGIPVIDADQITHDLLKHGNALYRVYLEHFGASCLKQDGELDRRAIAARVFQDPAEKAWIDRAAHPVIRSAIEEAFENLRARRREAFCVFDVPLLYEAGWDRVCAAVLVVSVPEPLQCARLMARDHLEKDEALRRIRAQMPLPEKCRRADFVVENTGSTMDFYRHLEALARENGWSEAQNLVPRKKRPRRVKQRETRRMGCALIAACLAFLLLLAVWGGLQLPSVQKKYIYPFPYQELVTEYAADYRVDRHLVAAVIKGESKFQNDVRSHRGAVGLMQLMPDTAAWIAKNLKDPQYSQERLQEPACNIRYGVWYLGDLEQEFHGNDILALAAYNAGRGNVNDWIQQYGWTRDFTDIDAIPYGETREYVRQVLKDKRAYERLYP